MNLPAKPRRSWSYGSLFPWWVDKSLAWFPEEFHWIISCTTWCDWQTIRDVRNVWLENASFKKEAFAQSGLLNTHLGPQDSVLGFKGRDTSEGIISEEVEFSLRVKKQTAKRIVYNPRIKVWHKVYPFRLRIGYIAKWGFWTGQSKKHLKAQNHSQADTIISSEYSLPKRILTGLFPKIFIQLFHKPKTALKRFSMSVFVLTSYL